MSTWRKLIDAPNECVLPWVGGRSIHALSNRSWALADTLPPEHGWWRFAVDGSRVIRFAGGTEPEMPPPELGDAPKERGYLVGNRLIPMVVAAGYVGSAAEIAHAGRPVFMVPLGLRRFAPVSVALWPGPARSKVYVFDAEELDSGPETAVEQAFQDRALTVSTIPGVTPGLDLAFRFVTAQRINAEQRRAELERQREIERQREEALNSIGTGVGRRRLAEVDFDAAARAALAVGGGEFLDSRPGHGREQAVVTFRYQHRRWECVCDKTTLRIMDSGICLGHGDEKGDRLFTLESICSVLKEAIDRDVLVVYRHAE